jgi:hypothetical protein
LKDPVVVGTRIGCFKDILMVLLHCGRAPNGLTNPLLVCGDMMVFCFGTVSSQNEISLVPTAVCKLVFLHVFHLQSALIAGKLSVEIGFYTLINQVTLLFKAFISCVF